MDYNVTVIQVTESDRRLGSKKVMDKVGAVTDTFDYRDPDGGCSIDALWGPADEGHRDGKSDAVLLSAVGGDGQPRWYDVAPLSSPSESCIRKGLGLFANIRPATSIRNWRRPAP